MTRKPRLGRSSITICAFSAEQVIRLTGLSKSQLRYWDRTEFFRPRFAFEDRRSPFSRIYSFRDVVGLRTLGILRNQHNVPLQYLRKVAGELEKYAENPWSEIVLYVRGKEVVFLEPKSGRPRTALKGQYEADIPLKRVAHDVLAETERLRERAPSSIGQIQRHRHIQHNATVIAGTRIPTKAIMRYREAGFSMGDILKEYPLLKKRDVEAAVAYEGQLARSA
jgi:uncharacterized protein (DUF433 family)